MSTLTMRQTFTLHRDAITRWIMTSAFFVLGSLAVTQ